MSDHTPDLEGLGRALEITITDTELFTEALRHRSFSSENERFANNERLEFLGDSVLSIIVTHHIFHEYPGLSEGQLAKVRSAVVSADALAEVARELNLGSFLLLGKGETTTNGADKASILSDAMEAVIAAVYLQSGLEAVRSMVLRLLDSRIRRAAAGPGGHDFKTRLQEYAARRYGSAPKYLVESEGPDHDKRFSAVVLVGGVERGWGAGTSKKIAEQAAAKEAWDTLGLKRKKA